MHGMQFFLAGVKCIQGKHTESTDTTGGEDFYGCFAWSPKIAGYKKACVASDKKGHAFVYVARAVEADDSWPEQDYAADKKSYG